MHTIRTIAIFLSILLYLIPGKAQSYITYTVQGDIRVNVRNKSTKLSSGDELTDKSVLTIGSSSKLVLIDETEKTMLTIKSTGTGTVASLISKEGNKKNSISSDYIAFVKKKVTSDNGGKDVNYMQAAGTSYRGIRPKFTSLVKTKDGELLNPLRIACNKAIEAYKNNDIGGLETASQNLESLGICRFDFELMSNYIAHSFNGQFVLDPLCLRDLAASLDSSRPFSEQLPDLPVPITPSTDNYDAEGNILANYYYMEAGESLVITIDCIGYCEIEVISLNDGIKATINDVAINYVNFEELETATIKIRNESETPATVMFAINAE